MRKTVLQVLALAALVSVAGCEPANAPRDVDSGPREVSFRRTAVVVLEDSTRGVTCYRTTRAIDCVPWSQQTRRGAPLDSAVERSSP